MGWGRYNVPMVKSTKEIQKKYLLVSIFFVLLTATCSRSGAVEQVATPSASLPIPGSSELPTKIAEDSALHPFEGAELAIAGADGNIQLADVESLQAVRLTNDAQTNPANNEEFIQYGEPTWSPSGEQLAYIRSIRSEEHPLDVDILVSNRDGESVEIDAEMDRPFYLFWSPNGDVISFLASRPGQPISLWVKDLANQGSAIDRGQPYYWDWAPDGGRLFAHVGGSAEFNPRAYLAFFELEDSQSTLDLAPLTFQAPAYSPDGNRILVSSQTHAGTGALLMLGTEGEILQEVDPLENRTSFAWSPDGSRFAVSEGPDLGGAHIGELSLFRINADELAEPEKKLAGDVIAFWWSPDGQKIAYFVPVLSPSDLTKPISMNIQDESELFLQLFVYDLDEEVSQRLATFRPTSEFFRILPYYDQYQRSATIWSADSKMIAYALIGETGTGQVFIVSVDGNQGPRRIAEGEIAYWAGQMH
jgi:Tol biopolymer transport system component